MKARNPSTGNLETVYVKALDSMPVGTIVDYEGQASDIPTGWETYGTGQIKKTSETRPLAGHIVNEYANSQTSAYSTEYANKAFGGTILWTNPNPSSSFSAQTITLSSEDYDCCEIIWRRQSTSIRYGYTFSTGKIPYNIITISGTQVLIVGDNSREYSFTSKNQISFAAGTGSGDNNSYAVPIYIIGYKTGLFN